MQEEIVKTEEIETITYRFLTGTWYEVTIPASKKDDPAYQPEELYDGYWGYGESLPDGVEVEEIEISHIWEDDLK